MGVVLACNFCSEAVFLTRFWWAPVAGALLLGLLADAALFGLYRFRTGVTEHRTRKYFVPLALVAWGAIFMSGGGMTQALFALEAVMLVATGYSLVRNRTFGLRLAAARVGVMSTFVLLGLWGARPEHRDMEELIRTGTYVMRFHLPTDLWLFEELRRRPESVPAIEASFTGSHPELALALHAVVGGPVSSRAKGCHALKDFDQLPPGTCPGQ
jgi:hypothetical protein